MINKDAKIYVAGHRGMVGSAIVRRLKADGYTNIITRTSKELDLRNQNDVERFFKGIKTRICIFISCKGWRNWSKYKVPFRIPNR